MLQQTSCVEECTGALRKLIERRKTDELDLTVIAKRGQSRETQKRTKTSKCSLVLGSVGFEDSLK
jgi:hypothetical protein